MSMPSTWRTLFVNDTERTSRGHPTSVQERTVGRRRPRFKGRAVSDCTDRRHREVVDQLEVNVSGIHARTDAEIAHATVIALGSHVWVPDTVHATIEDGWVRLTGTATWDFERKAAEDAVRYLAAVRGVSNDIRVTSSVPPRAVEDAVKTTLRRDADVDAARIVVSSEGGRVTLSGAVSSSRERDVAGAVACAVTGVSSVENNLAVSS
jgi:osmotically-inducible protein OsmY